MGARPYDPSTGRFLAVDPIPGGSLNNYDYAGQDPINNYDLSGKIFCDSEHNCRQILNYYLTAAQIIAEGPRWGRSAWWGRFANWLRPKLDATCAVGGLGSLLSWKKGAKARYLFAFCAGYGFGRWLGGVIKH